MAVSSTSIQHCATVHPQERVCTYKYNTTLYQREDVQDLTVTTYAAVEVACDSSEYAEARARIEPHPLLHSHAPLYYSWQVCLRECHQILHDCDGSIH